MHNHQNNKQNSQIEMDIAPFVPGHRPQVSYLLADGLTTATSTEAPATTSTTRRQNVLHDKAGNSQAQQVDKADDINNKVQCSTFHRTTIRTKPTQKDIPMFQSSYLDIQKHLRTAFIARKAKIIQEMSVWAKMR